MSSSKKKQLRKEQYMTERQDAASKEAKKLKRYTLSFWVAIALVFCIFIGVVVSAPIRKYVYRHTDVIRVGDHVLNAVELNYFYVDAINTYYSECYSNYYSMLGSSWTALLGFETGVPLDEQTYNEEAGTTWSDYFLDYAKSNIKATYAIYDEAVRKGYTLSEDEQSDLDSRITTLSLYAQIYGYDSVDAYLQNIYGTAATEKSYRAYLKVSSLVSSYCTTYRDELKFDSAALSAFDEEAPYTYNSYSYAVYKLSVSDFYAEGAGTKSEDGKTTEYSPSEKEAAYKAAKEVADKLAAGDYADLDAFRAAVKALNAELFPEEDKDDDNSANAKAARSADATAANEGEEDTVEATEGDEIADDVIEAEGKTDDAEAEDKTDDAEAEGKTDDAEGDGKADDAEKDDDTNDDKSEEEEKEEELPKNLNEYDDILYSSLSSLYRDWMIGKQLKDGVGEKEEYSDDDYEYIPRESGDTTVITYPTTATADKDITTVYVICYGAVEDNTFALRNFRLIYVNNSTQTSASTTDEKFEASKKEADLLLEKYKANPTDDNFSELAQKESDDSNSKSDGGKYENVYPGQMEDAFGGDLEDWCYSDERKPGDYDVVKTDSGYCVVYYVRQSLTSYRNYMVENALRSETYTAWYDELVNAMNVELITAKYVDTGIKIGTKSDSTTETTSGK